MEGVETIIIGGGQAGLAMSYFLGELSHEHILLERARIAERWRTQRWDSLMFQFPNWSIDLPGYSYAYEDLEAFSHKCEVVHFIEDYAARIQAPLRTAVNVLSLRPAASQHRYLVRTDQGEFTARNVVIATGPYQRPQVPQFSAGLPSDTVQSHASAYRNPGALPPGAVLVVGSGASGCQIAEELAESGRHVYLSVGQHRRLPRRYRGKDMFWWARTLGSLDQTVDSSPAARHLPNPLITGVRGGHDIDLRSCAANGMTLLGHMRDIRDGRIALMPDLEENLRRGDQAFEDFESAVDDYVSRNGMDGLLPPEDRKRAQLPVAAKEMKEVDIRTAGISSVIWATGYTLDFGWVELPPVFDDRGDPVHIRGVTAARGVYFLGLSWLHKLKSSILCGVGEDAGHLAQCITEDRTH